MSVSKRLAVLRSHRALGAQSSTLPPAVRRPCTHGDIGRVLHQPWLSRARLMMPPQVAMLSVQRGRLSALSDVRRRLGQHSAGRTAAKLVVRARLEPPAHGRRSTTMRGGLGRDFARGARSGGAHGGLARRGELPPTGRARGVRAPFSLGRRFTELR